MQVTASARHGHLSADRHAAVREKAEKLLPFFDRLTLIEVTVDLRTDGDTMVEVIVPAAHAHKFVGHAAGLNLMTALGGALDRVRAQDHRRGPGSGGGPG